MPDITMCTGEGCPKEKEKCYRYTANPDMYGQSYFKDPPHKEGDCEYYWPFGEKHKDIFKKNGGVCKECERLKYGPHCMYIYCQCNKFKQSKNNENKENG